MRSPLFVLPLMAFCLSVAGGCQKLNFEKSYQLEPHGLQEVIFSAPAYQQKVSVTITPASSAVSAYLCKEGDVNQVKSALDADKQPPEALLIASRASKGAAEPYSLEATIPAKTGYALVLKGSGQATEVKVKLVGR
jgi:hypothetical protein